MNKNSWAKPVVAVSKCLGFASCRYNGASLPNRLVERLKEFVDFVPVCPEVEIGLGIPRSPLRLVITGETPALIQPETGHDATRDMTDFANLFLESIAGGVDGFILKSRSPSCGTRDVKIYPRAEKCASISSKGVGMFGAAVQERFPLLPIEDEGRLTNFTIREHFLTTLFTRAAFREVKKALSMKALVGFHTEFKLLFMSYNQQRMRAMGALVANHQKLPLPEVLSLYEQELGNIFLRAPRYTSVINVLLHAFGYFPDELTAKEKAFFLETLEKYRSGKMPLSVLLNLLRSWIVRFDTEYLDRQQFFAPYPEALMEITDSGKGRNSIK